MAKAIKWQIEFQTNDPASPTSYRIDIYAEDDGSWSGITELTAGPQPFVTEEDKNTDFFTPVRSQTGTIQVCTRLSDGSILNINDLLPADNIAHPVRLINVTNSNAIEWQGFMSCEAFSQAYTEIPEIFSFPVLSVLEAMASVQISDSRSVGVDTISEAIYNAINEIAIQSGLTFYTYIYYSQSAWRIFQKKIDQSSLYNLKEFSTGLGITYVAEGISCKDVLSYLCTFMGWTVRERGTFIFFERVGGDIGWYRDTLSNFHSSFGTNQSAVAITGLNIAEMDWRGADHKRNISQGAKSVAIAAGMRNYELKLGLPDTPREDLEENPASRHTLYGEFYANELTNYYSNVTLRTLTVRWYSPSDHTDSCVLSVSATADSENYAHTVIYRAVQWYTDFEQIVLPNKTTSGYYTDYATAFFALTEVGNDMQPGLMVVGEPIKLYNDTNDSDYRDVEINDDMACLYEQRSVVWFRALDGKIKVSLKIGGYLTAMNGMRFVDSSMGDVKLRIALQWGSKWARKSGTQYTWVNYRTTIDMDIANGESEIEIPITADTNGEVKIYIYPHMQGYLQSQYSYIPDSHITDTITGLFITALNVEYVAPDLALYNQNDANHYYQATKAKFKEEVIITSELASSINNHISPSLVLETNGSDAIKQILYTTTGGTEERRPERDLLNRLASYYGAARQRLELQVKHPTAAALPLLKLNGISPDTRKYLPLAEHREWKEEICTLYCFETPN